MGCRHGRRRLDRHGLGRFRRSDGSRQIDRRRGHGSWRRRRGRAFGGGQAGIHGIHEVLDGDGVGQNAPCNLDSQDGRDLALLRGVDRLGARQHETVVLELVADRRQLACEMLRHEAEGFAHGSACRDVDGGDSGGAGELGQQRRRLHDPAVGQDRRYWPAARGGLCEGGGGGVAGDAASADECLC